MKAMPKILAKATPLSDVAASNVHVARAVRTLYNGGVIAYPTEAVFGLGCLPNAEFAIEKLLAIKRRNWRKGLLLIASSLHQVRAYAELPDGMMGDEVRASWPGPVTWLLQAHEDVPDWITGGRNTVAIRITQHPVARALCIRAGTAVVSTSANISNRRPITNQWVLRKQLGADLDFIINGPLGGQRNPTVIRDASNGRLIRAD